MVKISKIDVESLLSSVNQNLPQVPGCAYKNEIKADYVSHYGGWLFFFYDTFGKVHQPNSYRLDNYEAYYWLKGLLFSLTDL